MTHLALDEITVNFDEARLIDTFAERQANVGARVRYLKFFDGDD